MAEQYDAIAREYQRTKQSPLRRYVEAYTLFQLLGDLQDLRVLDLACGEGFYTRQIMQSGAAAVTGVDISPAMIELAEVCEQQEPLRISYHCRDVAELGRLGEFDLVSAAYLLHYAPNVEALQGMCNSIAANLRPGGRLVAINENPGQGSADYAGYLQYGFNKSVQEPRTEGSAITYEMVSGRSLIRFEAFYYSQAVYEAALTRAGFTDIRWQPLQLSPEGVVECGADYFQEYLQNPPVVGLECRL